MGIFLLLVLIVNAACTGWLLSQVRNLKRTVRGVARVQRDLASSTSDCADSDDMEL